MLEQLAPTRIDEGETYPPPTATHYIGANEPWQQKIDVAGTYLGYILIRNKSSDCPPERFSRCRVNRRRQLALNS